MNEANATPHSELIAELMNPNNPKNEREHAAVREIERLREALARPHLQRIYPLYTSPPERPWVGLTDEEILLISADCAASHQHTDIHFARAIESSLKEKNL